MGGLELNRKGASIWPSSLSLCLILCPSLCHWVVGGHHVPSSQTLICIISLWRGCINNALFPTQTHTHTQKHTGNTECNRQAVKSNPLYMCACAYALHAWLIFCPIMPAAILDQCSSVHYVCPHVLMKLSRLVLCLRNVETFPLNSTVWRTLESTSLIYLNFSHSAALERKERTTTKTL